MVITAQRAFSAVVLDVAEDFEPVRVRVECREALLLDILEPVGAGRWRTHFLSFGSVEVDRGRDSGHCQQARHEKVGEAHVEVVAK